MNNPTHFIKLQSSDKLSLLKISAILYQTDFNGQEEDDQSMKFYYSDLEAFESAVDRLEKYRAPDANWEWESGSLAYQNWNAVWEESYEPTQIGEICLIRAPFHTPAAEGMPEIVISPQMSFGTGHHPTTSLCIQEMSKMDLKNKTVLDYGSGTGILSIYADMKGAREVIGIDIEQNAVENARENADLNRRNLDFRFGNIDILDPSKIYDLIIANVNKNTIIANAETIAERSPKNGSILLSGFYERDVADILAVFEPLGFQKTGKNIQQNWTVLCLLKIC